MNREFWTKAFLILSRYSTEPEDSEEWRLKKIIGMVSALFGTLSWLGYGLLYGLFNERGAGLVCVGAGVLFILGLSTYGMFRRYAAFWYYVFVVHTLGITLVHVLLGGFALSGMVIVWTLLIPIETLVAYKSRPAFAMFLGVAAIMLVVAFLQPYYVRTTNHFPPSLLAALHVMNTLGLAVYVLLAVYYYVWRNEVLSRLVLREQEKGEALLLNILPKEIAAILKNENRVIADQFESATILFADIVAFTPMSATMTPTELVELLNEVYSSFDALVEKYGVEKIKTIGDCYMVAAGVPRCNPDHARVLTQLALDIRDQFNQHEFRGRRLKIRIGLNSGSVIAGVIGRKKFSYDLWGDAVNTASRMESGGAAGCIQVTDATYELIRDDFICESRGTVTVKGKGEMNIWYVLGKRG